MKPSTAPNTKKCIGRAPYKIVSDIWISLSAVKCVGDHVGDVKSIFCRVGSRGKECKGINRTAQTTIPKQKKNK
jgi:hypothetical protein